MIEDIRFSLCRFAGVSDFAGFVKIELDINREQFPEIPQLPESIAIVLEELCVFDRASWERRAVRDRALMLMQLVEIGAMCQRIAEDLRLNVRPETWTPKGKGVGRDD